LYAGTPSSGVYRSTDGGQSWQSVSAGLKIPPGVALRVTALVVDEQAADRVVVATAYGLGSQLAGGGVYESLDRGAQWQKLGEASEVIRELTLKSGLVYAATSKGLVRYGDPVDVAGPVNPIVALQPLANPNTMQVVILGLTLLLAGLVLVGRLEWLRCIPIKV
jgi:hypothetical protein